MDATMAVSLIVAKFIEPGQQTNKPTKQDKQTNRQTELAHYPEPTIHF
jgi:hypothetical protein